MPTAFWEDSLPHSDDIQLSRSFLDPERKAVYVWFGVGGMDEQAWIFFPHCPVALNCNLSFHFPLCLKHMCARTGWMDSVWEDDPDSNKLEFVFRDSKNVVSW